MLGDKALELIQELERCDNGQFPAFNEDIIRQVLEEMNTLYEQNQQDARNSMAGGPGSVPLSAFYLRHAALERNKRCLLAYLYNRLGRIKNMRWEVGSILLPEIKKNMCEPEVEWFKNYSKNLASYMKSLGEGKGLDLTQDLKPPKNLFVEVRCLQDYGEFELDEGEIVLLNKDSTHYLPMSHCQHLIRQGVLQHIS